MNTSGRYSGLTPAAQRTVARCRSLAIAFPESDSWVAHLVLTLLLDESLASACLTRMGITTEWIATGTLGAEVAQSTALEFASDSARYEGEDCSPSRRLDGLNDPVGFTRVLDRAAEISRRGLQDGGVSSVHLLLAILETTEPIRRALAEAGATEERIRAELEIGLTPIEAPLPVDEELTFVDDCDALMPAAIEGRFPSLMAPDTNFEARLSDSSPVWRVLDANLNRAREGLRVLDDYARFVANDDVVCHELKSMRHQLVAAGKQIESTAVQSGAGELTGHRDTLGDVGTTITTDGERLRNSLLELIVANCRRVQESLRSLEEFGKLVSSDFGATMKQLRYRSYTLEQMLIPRAAAESMRCSVSSIHESLKTARIYVLITESLCQLPWKSVVEECLAAGADVIQLREKFLTDRELLTRARWMSDVCHAANSLFIVNDRPDVAAASDADGVHVGQSESSVADCRRVLQPGQLVGVSTHDVNQVREAMTERADYIGVGPVFPSKTKSFQDFPGLTFVEQAARTAELPWFAIGGINPFNVPQLTRVGCRRIAVTSAVLSSETPGDVIRRLRQELSDEQPELG